MRFLNTLKNDIHFQMKYGFYYLYFFFSILYIAVLFFMPAEYQKITASLIILTDPAMLGIFFIGGIWLLEKGEGLHRFWCISPLTPMEYILSKSISLAALSTISADLIVLTAMRVRVHFAFLSLGILVGAVVFNLIGLMVASYARSVNHYMIIVVLPSVLLTIPPVLTAFGMTHPLLELFPGTALWHLIAFSIGIEHKANWWMWLNLFFWSGILLYIVEKRIKTALQSERGEGA
ncbi:ABC transporter [Faecalicatena sp. AGMB00832]|uniref:ABC transporter n=1 Tax=Faecalicatena faecalis TaxID=2726362 RepID=A0ABS6D319_9FIRM|nr:ABC transporter [Faecalicatena faecalis]MBU3875979.1 ABC transporter [Faecalicatena faecalis]